MFFLSLWGKYILSEELMFTAKPSPQKPPPVALSIAGSDSSGGAGIQADLRTFGAFGVYGTCALTALTAQNSTGVFAIEKVSSKLLSAQIEAVLSDMPVRAAKTGMLYSRAAVDFVRGLWEEQAQKIPLVVDPVLVSSSGQSLSGGSEDQKDFLKALCSLFFHAALVTPNLPEMEAILEVPPLCSQGDMESACREFYERFQCPVLLKGGHLPSDLVIDVFFDGKNLEIFSSPRIQGRHSHGTGCTLSAATTACLARGEDMLVAIKTARAYLQKALLCAPGLGKGSGPLGSPDGFGEKFGPTRTA